MSWLFQVFRAYPRNLYHYMIVSDHDSADQLRYELGILLGILFSSWPCLLLHTYTSDFGPSVL